MAAEKISKIDENITKTIASFFEILPFGISLMAVLGFSASISASTILLNPMAADLAPTIAIIIQKIIDGVTGFTLKARTRPARAKGRAKRVWESLIILE